MKCSKAQKWIALHREGELDAETRQQLMEHLAACESCSELSRAYRQNDRMAALIRAQGHVSDNDRNILTGRILDAIADIKKQRDQAGSVTLMDRVLDFFILPPTRLIALACVLIITLSFGYQQYTVYSRITELENQLSVNGKTYLAKARKADMDDCMRISSRYLSRLKADRKETESSLRKYFIDNPDKMNLYITLLCSHQYKSLRKHAGQDFIIMQDIFADYESETN